MYQIGNAKYVLLKSSTSNSKHKSLDYLILNPLNGTKIKMRAKLVKLGNYFTSWKDKLLKLKLKIREMSCQNSINSRNK